MITSFIFFKKLLSEQSLLHLIWRLLLSDRGVHVSHTDVHCRLDFTGSCLQLAGSLEELVLVDLVKNDDTLFLHGVARLIVCTLQIRKMLSMDGVRIIIFDGVH